MWKPGRTWRGRAPEGREAAEHSADGLGAVSGWPLGREVEWASPQQEKKTPRKLSGATFGSWEVLEVPLDQEGTSQGVRSVELVLACRGLLQRQGFKRLDLSKCKNLLIFPHCMV